MRKPRGKRTSQHGIGATERVTMTLTPELRARAEQVAGARRWSLSQLTREALKAHLDRLAVEDSEPTAA